MRPDIPLLTISDGGGNYAINVRRCLIFTETINDMKVTHVNMDRYAFSLKAVHKCYRIGHDNSQSHWKRK